MKDKYFLKILRLQFLETKLGKHELRTEDALNYSLQPRCECDFRSPEILRILPGERKSELIYLKMNLTLSNLKI
jgi:hypothetical protein